MKYLCSRYSVSLLTHFVSQQVFNIKLLSNSYLCFWFACINIEDTKNKSITKMQAEKPNQSYTINEFIQIILNQFPKTSITRRLTESSQFEAIKEQKRSLEAQEFILFQFSNKSNYHQIPLQLFVNHHLLMNYCIDVQSKAESKDSKNAFSDEEINTPSSFNQNLSQKQVELQEIKKKVPYRWQPEQHKQYIRFLIQRRELFDMTLQRKIVMGIHNLMSQYLKNRTSLQCRSHHQKMLLKYKTIDNIISAHTHLFQSNTKEQMPQNCENSVIDLFEPKIEGAISFFQDFLSFQAFPERTRGLSGHDGMVEIESYQYNQNFSFELD